MLVITVDDDEVEMQNHDINDTVHCCAFGFYSDAGMSSASLRVKPPMTTR